MHTFTFVATLKVQYYADISGSAADATSDSAGAGAGAGAGEGASVGVGEVEAGIGAGVGVGWDTQSVASVGSNAISETCSVDFEMTGSSDDDVINHVGTVLAVREFCLIACLLQASEANIRTRLIACLLQASEANIRTRLKPSARSQQYERV
jgi:hypothetical protein